MIYTAIYEQTDTGSWECWVPGKDGAESEGRTLGEAQYRLGDVLAQLDDVAPGEVVTMRWQSRERFIDWLLDRTTKRYADALKKLAHL